MQVLFKVSQVVSIMHNDSLAEGGKYSAGNYKRFYNKCTTHHRSNASKINDYQNMIMQRFIVFIVNVFWKTLEHDKSVPT